MAEIRSTMDMVMERLAQMDEASPDTIDQDEYIRKGMRLAAGFLRGDTAGLQEPLAECSEEEQPFVRKGAVRTLLRNIFLPREPEQKEAAEKAMQGLLEVGQAMEGMGGMVNDMKSILDRYLQQREELKKQLEEGFAQQMEMMEANIAQQTGMSMKMDPSQHPKFQEEWQRIQAEMNEQYGRAIDQYKAHIEQQIP